MLILDQVRLSTGYLSPAVSGIWLGESPPGLKPPQGIKKEEEKPTNLFSIILVPAFYQEVHLIQNFSLWKIKIDAK